LRVIVPAYVEAVSGGKMKVVSADWRSLPLGQDPLSHAVGDRLFLYGTYTPYTVWRFYFYVVPY
jgi:hypothetical protein